MKKITSMLLALAICLSLCACGNSSDKAPAGAADTPVTTEQVTEAKPAATYVQLGQPIDVNCATISFTDVKLAYTIGESFSVTAQDGMRFFGIVGTIENTGGVELPVDKIRAEMIFNDEFTYTARATIGGKRNTSNISVAPLAKAEYWVYAEIPDALLEKMSVCEVRISLNEDFASLPENVEHGDYTIQLVLDEGVCKSAIEAQNTATEFFAECPILPTPVNYFPVWQTNSSSSSFNGKVSSIKYGFSVSPGRSDDIKEIYTAYVEKLQSIGFTLQNDSGSNCDIYSDGTKLGTVTVDGNRITFDLVPGNENLTAVPTGTTSVEANVSSGDTVVKIGDAIETDYVSMTLETVDSNTEIRSGSGQYGTYRYYTSENGDPYFYVYGTLKNLGGNPVDVRNMYVQFCFDGKYNYKGSVEGVSNDYGNFINDVSPLANVNYYMYTAVPQELIDSYTTCTVRIGFTENFDYKVVDVNDLPKFENCDDIFLLEITR